VAGKTSGPISGISGPGAGGSGSGAGGFGSLRRRERTLNNETPACCRRAFASVKPLSVQEAMPESRLRGTPRTES
jgi:hypothetical protein